MTQRQPDETYKAYRERISKDRKKLDLYLCGTPILPIINDGKKLLKVINEERKTKKLAMQAMGVKSGKRYRALLKIDRKKNKDAHK